jgi:hypothetical protein
MGKEKKMNKQRKKETQQLLFEKFFGVMEEYKSDLKEKKLISRLQKMSKFFATDIVNASAEKNGKQKKGKKKVEEAEQQVTFEVQNEA